jgi:hypothetical protein
MQGTLACIQKVAQRDRSTALKSKLVTANVRSAVFLAVMRKFWLEYARDQRQCDTSLSLRLSLSSDKTRARTSACVWLAR